MYVLQAILLILKLYPYRVLFWVQEGGSLNKAGYTFNTHFSGLSWWIILIPTFMLLIRKRGGGNSSLR